MRMKLRKLSNALGAEVMNITFDDTIKPGAAAELKHTLLQNNILLFRDWDITPQQHVAFTKLFGEVEPNEAVAHLRHPENPDIVLVTNEARNGKVLARTGRMWHSDHSFITRPTAASLLHAKTLPDVGGDTVFANMYLAYETLSEGLKKLLDPLEAIHDVTHGLVQVYGPQDREALAAKRQTQPPIAQPVVRTHPETGRKALYVNEMLTRQFVGLTEEESQPLLKYLFVHSVRPEFTYRHQWRRNDLLVWDNRCSIHLALADFDENQTRTMYRTAVAGIPCGRVAEEAAAAALN
jgi:taurine dioxygenase